MDYEKRKKLEQKADQEETFLAWIEVRNGVYIVSVESASGVFKTKEEAEAFAKEHNATDFVEILNVEDKNDCF